MTATSKIEVILEPDVRPPLPTGPALHEHVRRSVPQQGGDPPAAFVEATARLRALEEALDAEREQLHALMREAYRHGVPLNTLARWSGYTSRWVGVIAKAAA